jgi:hypothetical protein
MDSQNFENSAHIYRNPIIPILGGTSSNFKKSRPVVGEGQIGTFFVNCSSIVNDPLDNDQLKPEAIGQPTVRKRSILTSEHQTYVFIPRAFK